MTPQQHRVESHARDQQSDFFVDPWTKRPIGLKRPARVYNRADAINVSYKPPPPPVRRLKSGVVVLNLPPDAFADGSELYSHRNKPTVYMNASRAAEPGQISAPISMHATDRRSGIKVLRLPTSMLWSDSDKVQLPSVGTQEIVPVRVQGNSRVLKLPSDMLDSKFDMPKDAPQAYTYAPLDTPSSLTEGVYSGPRVSKDMLRALRKMEKRDKEEEKEENKELKDLRQWLSSINTRRKERIRERREDVVPGVNKSEEIKGMKYKGSTILLKDVDPSTATRALGKLSLLKKDNNDIARRMYDDVLAGEEVITKDWIEFYQKLLSLTQRQQTTGLKNKRSGKKPKSLPQPVDPTAAEKSNVQTTSYNGQHIQVEGVNAKAVKAALRYLDDLSSTDVNAARIRDEVIEGGVATKDWIQEYKAFKDSVSAKDSVGEWHEHSLPGSTSLGDDGVALVDKSAGHKGGSVESTVQQKQNKVEHDGRSISIKEGSRKQAKRALNKLAGFNQSEWGYERAQKLLTARKIDAEWYRDYQSVVDKVHFFKIRGKHIKVSDTVANHDDWRGVLRRLDSLTENDAKALRMIQNLEGGKLLNEQRFQQMQRHLQTRAETDRATKSAKPVGPAASNLNAHQEHHADVDGGNQKHRADVDGGKAVEPKTATVPPDPSPKGEQAGADLGPRRGKINNWKELSESRMGQVMRGNVQKAAEPSRDRTTKSAKTPDPSPKGEQAGADLGPPPLIPSENEVKQAERDMRGDEQKTQSQGESQSQGGLMAALWTRIVELSGL